MSGYFKRLKIHPGVPVATMMTVLFVLSGLSNRNWETGVIAGLVVSALMWSVVLWTARTQPLPRQEEKANE